jgi:hypothetical protein
MAAWQHSRRRIYQLAMQRKHNTMLLWLIKHVSIWVQISRPVSCNKLAQIQNKVLKSSIVSGMSQYGIYLKLYLYGLKDPISLQFALILWATSLLLMGLDSDK